MQEKAKENRTLTCRCCKKLYSKINMIEILPRYYVHKSHLEEFKKTEEYKTTILLDEFYRLSQGEFDYTIMMRQLKSYIKDYGFTLEGIKYSLDYYIATHGWDTQYGLNQFLPTYYDKAEAYYKHLKSSKQSLKNSQVEVVKDFRNINNQPDIQIINTEF